MFYIESPYINSLKTFPIESEHILQYVIRRHILFITTKQDVCALMKNLIHPA
jgi:hypothetical protein